MDGLRVVDDVKSIECRYYITSLTECDVASIGRLKINYIGALASSFERTIRVPERICQSCPNIAQTLTCAVSCDTMKYGGIVYRLATERSADMQPHMNPRSAREGLPRWDGPLSHPFYSRYVKRLMDVLLALILLLPCALVMIPIAAAVKATSEGPVFYTALRGGYHNRPFSILKFRTMVVGADRYSSTTALDDPRVTRVGRMLRHSKLDELPQLFNILKGDMSFIGPRPELLKYTSQYTEEQQCILWVRPGVTDPGSIKLISLDELVGHDDPEGNYEKRILGEKNRMRVEYAQNQSFGLDARVFLGTLRTVLQKNLRSPKAGFRQGVSK